MNRKAKIAIALLLPLAMLVLLLTGDRSDAALDCAEELSCKTFPSGITVSGPLTVSGAATISGAQTFTADLTLSGAGIDLLGNAADQNEIGSDAIPFEKIWTNELDVEDAFALAADLTISGAGNDILAGADGVPNIGASATEFGTAWIQTIDDGDGTVTVAAATALQGDATVTGNVLPEADGTRSVGTAAASYLDVFSDNGNFDELRDEAGTGAPSFPEGYSVAAGKRASVKILGFGAGVSETIASAAISTVTNSYVEVNDATANLDCIDDTGLSDGDLLIITNPGGANTVTGRDNQACTPPQEPLQLGAATRALVGDASLTLLYDAGQDEFIEVAFAANN